VAEEDAGILQCTDELARTLKIASEGTSSDRQRAVYAERIEQGDDHDAAMRTVVHHLIEEFRVDL